jgi:tetratricopeptide (TPR) repeat protein
MRRIHVVLLSLIASAAMAGTVELKNGSKVEGEMHRAAHGWEIRQQDGKVVTVDEDDIASVTLGASKPAGQADAADPLGALRKSVESQADLNAIIRRYETFIKQSEGKPYEAEAKADLALWQDRQAKGMKKVGGAWGDPSAAQEAFVKSAGELAQAAGAIRAGQLPEATKAVEAILSQNPQNPGALYLQGLIAARQSQFPQARKAFENAASIAPWHGPALNNAAAVEWHLRAYSVALANLEKAMTALPLSQPIHDNVAEVLHSPLREVKSSPVTRRLAKQYEKMEPQLEELQAKQGLHRWGGSWISDAQYAEIQKQEEANRKQLDELAANVTEAQTALDRAEERIREFAHHPDPNGTWNEHFGAPAGETEQVRKQREQDRLEEQRRAAADKLDQARAAQEQFRSKGLPATYAGQLQLMSEDLVFGLPPETATSQPSQPKK